MLQTPSYLSNLLQTDSAARLFHCQAETFRIPTTNLGRTSRVHPGTRQSALTRIVEKERTCHQSPGPHPAETALAPACHFHDGDPTRNRHISTAVDGAGQWAPMLQWPPRVRAVLEPHDRCGALNNPGASRPLLSKSYAGVRSNPVIWPVRHLKIRPASGGGCI